MFTFNIIKVKLVSAESFLENKTHENSLGIWNKQITQLHPEDLLINKIKRTCHLMTIPLDHRAKKIDKYLDFARKL